MKNTFSDKINQFESPVSEGIFEQIMHRRQPVGTPAWLYWTIILTTFTIVLILTNLPASQDPSLTAQTDSYDNNARKIQAPIVASTRNLATQGKVNSKESLAREKLQVYESTAQSNLEEAANAPLKTLSNKSVVSKGTATPQKKLNSKTKALRVPSQLASLSTFNPNSNPSTISGILFTEGQNSRGLENKQNIVKNKAIPTLPILQNDIEWQPKIAIERPGDCYSFNRTMEQISLFSDLLVSPDYITPSFEAKSKEYRNYIRQRKETEDYQLSYSTQIGLGVQTKRGLVFKVGANYSRYNTRFHKSNPSFKKIIIEQIFDNNGDFVREDTLTEIGTLDIQHFNKQEFIGIPLTVGYMTANQKLNIGFNLGVQLNIRMSTKGRIIGSDEQVSKMLISSINPNPVYKEKIGLQGIANFVLAYGLTSKFDLILSPHVKFMPKSITQETYPLRENLMTAGIWVGGRLHF